MTDNKKKTTISVDAKDFHDGIRFLFDSATRNCVDGVSRGEFLARAIYLAYVDMHGNKDADTLIQIMSETREERGEEPYDFSAATTPLNSKTPWRGEDWIKKSFD